MVNIIGPEDPNYQQIKELYDYIQKTFNTPNDSAPQPPKESPKPAPEPAKAPEQAPKPAQETPKEKPTPQKEAPSNEKQPGSNDKFNPQVVLDLTNELRAQNGKKPLKMHPALAKEAYEHAKYMQSVNDLTHDRPQGTSLGENLQKAGVKGNIAENIVQGALTDKDVYNSWATSEDHKVNMLGDYDYMGVAISGPFASQELAHA
ncbi:hypothetical protein CONCODRAFT_71797 [Conidiobolus coronatus NRRL 28638]|uniref:SCP domain-containing protein n=1 Tax=Conidiobolus coronatus (strain ATCC 28846 / CBS 209.66 / NRRL 28638) TaxID=796925 RepID=A0A137P287_CONC2|nr:hypothetical protein CONCODRAFT_71797 [Conidiobolus coronatus NRRL 28638]|eukprot:KXN69019.1 hypothetical protein CONCODRAFT_71797 [Conidiobolus coronatus NRRL 28638]